MKIKIAVTQDDIDEGCKSHRTNCPVARAVGRALADATGRTDLIVHVGAQLVIVERHEYRRHRHTVRHWGMPPDWALVLRHQLPDKVDQFIDRFDNGAPVRPITFTLFV